MNLENIMKNERSQTQRYITLFHLYDISKSNRSIKTKSRLVVARSYGGKGITGHKLGLWFLKG
jgi:hypothetical protein